MKSRGTQGVLLFENSPVFQGWDGNVTTSRVPSGTTEPFFRPGGLVLVYDGSPSVKTLGYCQNLPSPPASAGLRRGKQSSSSLPTGRNGRVAPGEGNALMRHNFGYRSTCAFNFFG